MVESQYHVDYATGYMKDMKKHVDECNAKLLASSTANAIGAINDSLREKEISLFTARGFRKEVDKIIDSFDKNCKCRKVES